MRCEVATLEGAAEPLIMSAIFGHLPVMFNYFDNFHAAVTRLIFHCCQVLPGSILVLFKRIL